MIKTTNLLMLLSICFLFLWVEMCRAEQQDVPVYQIGPYPAQYEKDGIKDTFWIWLRFTPVTIGRVNPTYKLKLTIFVQVNGLPRLLASYAAQKLPTDNCARFNVDNWVYHVVPAPLEIRKAHSLRLTATGDISTWTCLPGIQETVCRSLLDCTLRDGNPIKTINLQQGFEATKDWYLDITADGKLTYGDPKPQIYFTGDNPGAGFLNIVALLSHNLSAALQHSMVTMEDKIPADYKFLNPRYEWAGFVLNNGIEWMTADASVSITSSQIGDFMQKYFPNTWQGLIPEIAPKREKMTKQLMHEECDKYAPGQDILDCASSMGWDYPSLPEE